eukprot:TRINITY_DN12642_c0_g1_i1.p1 TRINITY_DN12642_c0_g1~~TRINITY_DN12642_c0_g1_i1.p1  ORF type:complete len:500 (-),score=52.60 TRINITY_DN12642_c0_g1_i1:533-2032(-)
MAASLETEAVPAVLLWPDVDCLPEQSNDTARVDTWAPLRNVLGEDDANDDSMDWVARVGFGVTEVSTDSWHDADVRLREVLPLAAAAMLSSCLAVRVMGEVLAFLFGGRKGTVAWGPVEMLAASRFPIFRTLCAAADADDLAAPFQLPLRTHVRDEGWALQVEQLAHTALSRPHPGDVGAGWVMLFILGLMGFQPERTADALSRIQAILESYSVQLLLNSSFFCVLHALKLWRTRALLMRRPLEIPPAATWRNGEPLYVTAAWGSAALSIPRRLSQAKDLSMDILTYCLDARAWDTCRETDVGWCVPGSATHDVHGASYKYEVLLAVVRGGRTAVWVDLDSHFLADPADAIRTVQSIGVVRHAHAACANGGLVVLTPEGADGIEHLIHWLHYFPFGYEQNGLNALVRGVAHAPTLTARIHDANFLDAKLFTSVDGVGVDPPVWLHWPTPPGQNFDAFFEEVASHGALGNLLGALRQEPRLEILDCGIFQAAVKAPILLL